MLKNSAHRGVAGLLWGERWAQLEHVAVVRELRKIGDLKSGQAFSQDFQLDRPSAPGDARLIAFVQQRQQGKVLGLLSCL